MSIQIFNNTQQLSIEDRVKLFELEQREASVYSKSKIVPKMYQNNISDCIIAMNYARRMGADTLMIMQNLHIIQGKPSWSSSFLIALINNSGKYAPLRYEVVNNGKKQFNYSYFDGFGQHRREIKKTVELDDIAVTAYTTDKEGVELKGEAITTDMVLREGWYDKQGSKWQTMPMQMYRYRAAAFWSRVYAPDLMLGISHTSDELQDIEDAVVVEDNTAAPELGTFKLDEQLQVNAELNKQPVEAKPEPQKEAKIAAPKVTPKPKVEQPKKPSEDKPKQEVKVEPAPAPEQEGVVSLEQPASSPMDLGSMLQANGMFDTQQDS